MAWNKNLPTNATKIRNYPTVLTDNFKAIEEGNLGLNHWEVRLVDRDSLTLVSNPTRDDDMMIFFSKNDTSVPAETEAFIMDDRSPTANVIQITEDGKLGSSTTEGVFLNISVGTTPFEVGTNLFIVASATVTGAGVLTNGVNITGSVRNSQGNYDITVAADILLNANYRVIAQAYNLTSDSGRRTHVRTKPVPAGGVPTVIKIIVTGQPGNTHDEQFDVIVIGGR